MSHSSLRSIPVLPFTPRPPAASGSVGGGMLAATEFKLRQEQGTQTQTFWSRYPGEVGVFHVNGVGAQKLGMSFEAQGNQTLWRDVPGFLAACPGGARKVEKNSLCLILGPLSTTAVRRCSGFPSCWLDAVQEPNVFTMVGHAGAPWYVSSSS